MRRVLQWAVFGAGVLLLGELVARWLVPLPEVANFNRVDFSPLEIQGGLAEVAKTGGWPGEDVSYRPVGALRNLTLQWISEPDGIERSVALNLYGFRGADFAIEKTPGRPRVLFLGDGAVEGVGSGEGETIPAAFARHLGSGRFEVINLGIVGAELPEQLTLAARAIPLLKPDAVVQLLQQNDLPADAPAPREPPEPWAPEPADVQGSRLLHAVGDLWEGVRPATRFRRGPFPYFLAAPHPSNRGLRAERFPVIAPALLEAVNAGRLDPFLPLFAENLEARLLSWLDDSNSGRSQLATLRTLTNGVGSTLLVGFIPANVTVSDHYYPFWQELGADFRHDSLTGPKFARHRVVLAETLDQLGIPFVDVTERLREEEAQGRRMYTDYDGRMRPAGNEAIGRALARRFEEERL